MLKLMVRKETACLTQGIYNFSRLLLSALLTNHHQTFIYYDLNLIL